MTFYPGFPWLSGNLGWDTGDKWISQALCLSSDVGSNQTVMTEDGTRAILSLVVIAQVDYVNIRMPSVTDDELPINLGFNLQDPVEVIQAKAGRLTYNTSNYVGFILFPVLWVAHLLRQAERFQSIFPITNNLIANPTWAISHVNVTVLIVVNIQTSLANTCGLSRHASKFSRKVTI